MRNTPRNVVLGVVLGRKSTLSLRFLLSTTLLLKVSNLVQRLIECGETMRDSPKGPVRIKAYNGMQNLDKRSEMRLGQSPQQLTQ